MDEDTARRRLLIYTLVRFAGLAIFFVGIATMYTKLLRPGGWPQAGAIIAIAGVIVSLLAPRLIKKRWDERER
jgi:multisubunit Na+/H+ antiporter MnhB subunit